MSEAKRQELVEQLEGLVRPVYEGQLALLRELALAAFKQQLAMGGAPGEAFVDRAQRWVGAGPGRGAGPSTRGVEAGRKGGRLKAGTCPSLPAHARPASLAHQPPLLAPLSTSWRSFSGDALEQFDSQLGEVAVPDTDWEAAPARAQLERDIAAHIHAARCGRAGRTHVLAMGWAAGRASKYGCLPLIPCRLHHCCSDLAFAGCTPAGWSMWARRWLPHRRRPPRTSPPPLSPSWSRRPPTCGCASPP